MVTKKERQDIDSNITEFLISCGNEQSARTIAQAVGFKNAKDIINRLQSLYSRDILQRIKIQNKVMWTIERPLQSGPNVTSCSDHVMHSTEGNSELITIIKELKQEMLYLKAQVDMIQKRQNITSIIHTIPPSTPQPANVQTPQPIDSQPKLQDNPGTKKSTKNSWSPVSTKRKKSSTSTRTPTSSSVATVPTQNRYGALKYINNSCYDACDPDCDNSSTVACEPDCSSNDACEPDCDISSNVDQHPDTGAGRKVPVSIVPGIQSYSHAHQNTISIVTDSMTNGIRSRDFNEHLEFGKAIFKKFMGATASEIKEYSGVTIRRDTPQGLLVVAGANDVSYGCQRGQTPDAKKIAEEIIDIGIEARNKGVKNVFISGLITRRGLRVEMIRREVNHFLYSMCLDKEFYFINNDNIGIDGIYDDGLHLNRFGSATFQENLLRCFDRSLYIY